MVAGIPGGGCAEVERIFRAGRIQRHIFHVADVPHFRLVRMEEPSAQGNQALSARPHVAAWSALYRCRCDHCAARILPHLFADRRPRSEWLPETVDFAWNLACWTGIVRLASAGFRLYCRRIVFVEAELGRGTGLLLFQSLGQTNCFPQIFNWLFGGRLYSVGHAI